MTKFSELIDLHIEDMSAVGKPPQRSKTATLAMRCRESAPDNPSRPDNPFCHRHGDAAGGKLPG